MELGLDDKIDLDTHRVPLAIVFRCGIHDDYQTFVLPLPNINHSTDYEHMYVSALSISFD
jgi:hypothetical protein